MRSPFWSAKAGVSTLPVIDERSGSDRAHAPHDELDASATRKAPAFPPLRRRTDPAALSRRKGAIAVGQFTTREPVPHSVTDGAGLSRARAHRLRRSSFWTNPSKCAPTTSSAANGLRIAKEHQTGYSWAFVSLYIMGFSRRRWRRLPSLDGALGAPHGQLGTHPASALL
jgi:hypothetical protein